MYWYDLIIGLVLCGAALSLPNENKLRRYMQILYFSIVPLIIVLFVGLRSSSPDYDNYLSWFSWVSAGQLVWQDWAKDPAFVLVSCLVSKCGLHFIGVTLVFAVAAVTFQYYFSRIASDQKWITFFFYLVVCRTFFGSDMASIRSAVAIPLMSSSILLAFRGKKRLALLLYVVSLTFHFSVLVGLLPFALVMMNVRFRSRWWILSLASAAVLAKIYFQNILVLMSYGDRTSVYTDPGEHGTPFAYFMYIAARVLLLLLIMQYCWKSITAEHRLVLFCYSIGISLQVIFIFNNALSWRASDIFGLLDICVFMIPLKYLKGGLRISYAVGLTLFGLALCYFGLAVMEPYRWVLA